ncbi:M20/M25/M40 family metallo-hydrolase [bacterium]|nr:M20/M25/M40 family metallo-hydrolase [bacterium]
MKRFTVLVIMVCAAASAAAQQENPDPQLSVFHTISSERLLAYADTLSSPGFGGRLTGSPGFTAAAQWVAGYLERWGLQPAGDASTYFQTFEIPWVEVKDAGALGLHLSGNDGEMLDKWYRPVADFYPGTNSDSGSVTAEVIYAGHGVTAPERGYDDYAGIDVRGKIVLIDIDVPVSRDDDQYADWVPYCYHQYKLNNAAAHGAAGLLYVNHIANPNTSYNEGLIYCHISGAVAEDIFFNTGKSYSGVKKRIQDTRSPASFATGKTVTITAHTVFHPRGEGCNVAGLIPGSDPKLKEEVIIVGGHLDGVGDLGFLLPGALDNGSGVANMMEAARALAQSPVAPKRSILFLFIGGEECGLLGSQLYCRNPLFPKENTVAYFNLDMVGTGSGLRVGGVESFPLIEACFTRANDQYIHRPLRVSEYREPGVGRPRSDGVIFAREGYRSFSFGTFRQEGDPRTPTYYHHPLDRIDTLDPEIMEDVAKLMYLGLTRMARADRLFR